MTERMQADELRRKHLTKEALLFNQHVTGSRFGGRHFNRASRAAASALAVVAALGVARRAQAETVEPPADPRAGFGAAGQFVLSVDRLAGVDLSMARSDANGTNGSALVQSCSGTKVNASFFGSSSMLLGACAPIGFGAIRWGADVFVARGLSLGGTLEITSESDDATSNGPPGSFGSDPTSTTSRSITFSPRLGYAHALGSTWTIWPRAGIDWVDSKIVMEHHIGTPDGLASDSRFAWHLVRAALDLKFVYSPLPHVGLFGGPFATLPLSMRSESTSNGTSVEVRSKVYEVGAAGGVLLYL
ncbi:MAG TPA: hypothetical protein VKC59_00490 [Candidatus Limnocylindrales bacterium]|nr:hypothetical protein [Candidatus Limnocylindrales bacterium]